MTDHTDAEGPATVTLTEPTAPGFYAYDGGAQTMIFLLTHPGQWMVWTDSGVVHNCEWGYIEQALGVWHLARVADLTADLAAAREQRDHWEREYDDACQTYAQWEQVIANVRARIDEWPTGEGQEYRRAVTQCAAAIRALLPTAPTGADDE